MLQEQIRLDNRPAILFAVFKLLEGGVAPHEIEAKLMRMGPVDLDLLYGALECVLDAMGTPPPQSRKARPARRTQTRPRLPAQADTPETRDDSERRYQEFLALAG